MKFLTPKQSRQARSLLKWNLHDVVSKCKLQMRRLDHFERGIARLTRTENEQLTKVFIDHGILFTKDYDVRLLKVENAKKQSTRLKEHEDLVLDSDYLNELQRPIQKEEITVEEEEQKDHQERERLLIKGIHDFRNQQSGPK